jgi:hypothetical protein
MVKKNFENGEASLVDLKITSGNSDPCTRQAETMRTEESR